MNDLQPGRLHGIAPGVRRLVAPNPSLMTGPGTNTYLLGDPVLAVIDPGPDEASHLAAIRMAAPSLCWILVTHQHPDHSDGAQALAASTGAGAPTALADGESIEIAGAKLTGVATPGHAADHICYLLESEALLFSGDHILDGMTPVIMPPEGDMSAYLESLRALRALPLRAIAPGHGRVITDPRHAIDSLIAHRLRREAKVLGALRDAGRATLDTLLPKVYDDVRPELLKWARLSLEAHLIKLERDGFARRAGTDWFACTPISS